MSYGCVIFDDQRPEQGWASLNGEKAFFIRGVGDLRSDVLWWTNIEFDNFYTSSLYRMGNMRNAEFLRSPMNMIREELGLTQRFMPSSKSVVGLSEVFSRVMTMAEMHYGLENSNCQKLFEDLRAILMPADRHISIEMDTAVKAAYQTLTKCTKNPRTKTRKVLFKRNRYKHGMDVLSTPVPSEQFEYIERAKLPPKGRRLQWIAEQGRPVLAEAAVLSVAPSYANVIAFGSGSNHRRRWISHPELFALQNFATIEIESVFLFDSFQPIGAKYAPPMVEDIGYLSVSIGLLMENYWIALASPTTTRGNTDKIYTPRHAWLRASDRVFTMIPAMGVFGHGIQVDSYGVGSVSIDVPNGNMPEVIEIAGKHGLYPPHHAPDDAIIQADLA